MKFINEVKLGLIGIVTIAVLIWGINYLKGRNVLKGKYTLYTFFQESGGLENSAPVLLNGVKVGFVDQIILRTDKDPPIKAVLSIEDEFSIAEASHAELFSVDLMGSKAIRIISSGRSQVMNDLDTILSATAPDLVSSLQSSLFPIFDQLGILAGSLDTLFRRVDSLIAQDALSETLDHLSSISGSLKGSLDREGSLGRSFSNLESFTGMMEEQKDEMASLITGLNAVVAALDSAGLDRLAVEFQDAARQFHLLIDQVNSGEGSAGKLIYSDTLYENLNLLVRDLDVLVRDLNENPEDYVQISIFGKSKRENRQK
ncbi:MAG: MlaD family protein [Bacteroidota bacterium]